MRAIRLGLFVGGALALVILVSRIGPATVFASISEMGWRVLVVLCFPFSIAAIFDTLGWRFAFRDDRVPFRALLGARLAGEAFNMTTPTAQVGGEAVKAWLIRDHVSLEASLPSVIVAKTTITIAQGVLLVAGILCAIPTLPPGSPLLRVMLWLLGVEIVAIGGFILVQLGGMVRGGGRLLDRLRLGWAAQRLEPLVGVDDALARFYRRQPRRLLLSTACHFLGWMVSAVEAYVILNFLHVPVSLAGALVIEAFGTAVKFATFLVPASLGALEGGHMAATVALGFGAAQGISFSLVRRLREATWVGVGLIALATMRSRSSPVVTAPVSEA